MQASNQWVNSIIILETIQVYSWRAFIQNNPILLLRSSPSPKDTIDFVEDVNIQ